MDKNTSKDNLLERFYSGESTPEEECLLKDMLEEKEDSNSVIDRILLSGLSGAASRTELPERLGDRITEASEKHLQCRKRISPITVAILSVAAAAAITVGIFFGLEQNSSLNPAETEYTAYVPEDTFDNPEEAYAETVKALSLMAKYLGKGMEKTHELISVTEESANNTLNRIIEHRK